MLLKKFDMVVLRSEIPSSMCAKLRTCGSKQQ